MQYEIAKRWYNASGIWRETVSAILGLTQINQELKFLVDLRKSAKAD